jgi:glucose-6-phosphate 1-dehydrogenase
MLYQIHPVTMDFTYASSFTGVLPEAYERLLLDILRGDSTLFTRSDELEAAWTFITPVLAAWDRPDFEPERYAAGTWGPQAADRLLADSRRSWRKPMS